MVPNLGYVVWKNEGKMRKGVVACSNLVRGRGFFGKSLTAVLGPTVGEAILRLRTLIKARRFGREQQRGVSEG